MAVEINPTVVPKKVQDVLDMREIYAGTAPRIHIDVSDGRFADGRTWDNPDELPLDFSNDLKYEVHLMVENPEEIIGTWLARAPERIIFHAEACKSAVVLAEKIRSVGIEPVIAVNFETPISKLEEFVPDVNSFHLLSINKLGHQGAEFNPGIFKKISSCKELYPDAIISIDGGVNLENAHDLALCGASRLCVGAALKKSANPAETYKKFLAAVK